ncbi:MAG: COX15/CtaA family protein [Rickettsiales bacterium]
MDMMQPLPKHQRAVTNWLLVCLVLVVMMVAVGGVTRLTESGLSIVEWKLVSGTLPPMSDAAWQAEFDAYKHTPQFKKVNSGFTVDNFKGIFWLEYIHRLLGRIIGMVIILPFLYFAARRQLPKRLLWRGFGIAMLVAAQGTVGWVMVASGLHDEPRVAPLKLGLHLLLAFMLFCLLLWTRWQVQGHARRAATKLISRGARVVFVLLLLQIFLGALVAGLRAGLTYNTYPLMNGQFIPDGMHLLSPWWLNHLESSLTVQFQHRMGALALVGASLALIFSGWKRDPALRPLFKTILGLLLLQFCLGVAALLSVVNLWLASAHQLVALALLAHFLKLVYLAPLDGNQRAEGNTP